MRGAPSLMWSRSSLSRFLAGGLGFTALAFLVWAAMSDLRWGGGWNAGPATGSARALAVGALVELVAASGLGFAAGFDASRSQRSVGRAFVRSLRGPLAAILIATTVAITRAGSVSLVALFLLSQCAVALTASVAAASGVLLGRTFQDPATGLLIGATLLVGWLCLVFVVGPAAPQLSRHPRLFQAVLAADPSVTVTRVLGVDYLRGERVYRLTPLALHRFGYPPAAAGLAIQGLAASSLLTLAAIRNGPGRRKE